MYDSPTVKSMIKLLESQKSLIHTMLSDAPEDREKSLMDWGVAVMFILSTLKGAIAYSNSEEATDTLIKMEEEIDKTINELRQGIGYNGPIGQA
jgi:hypothetical protein